MYPPSEDSSIHSLPQQWLAELLHEITSNQPMLCATRRSAGIPFAIQVWWILETKMQDRIRIEWCADMTKKEEGAFMP